MRAVLISIRPKWCEKIINGDKTIEVRKTRPKLDTPFKCYIYCTLPKYPHEDFIATDYPRPQFYGGGKVIGEFTCDRIDWITHIGYTGIPNLVETRICDVATMRTSPVGGLLNAACGSCPCDQAADVNGEYSFDCEWKRPLTRAPQSWGYVEDVHDEHC